MPRTFIIYQIRQHTPQDGTQPCAPTRVRNLETKTYAITWAYKNPRVP